MRARALLCLGVATTLALAGCDDDSAESLPTAVSVPSTELVATSRPIESNAPETIARARTLATPVATTPPATTTTTTTTTTTLLVATTSIAVAPPELTLRADGLGEFDFGDLPDGVLAASNEAFGNPSSDVTIEYPDFDGSSYTTNGGIDRFLYPVGRMVCWEDLCLQFGGTHGGASFVGWTYGGEAPGATTSPAVTNRDGVTIGSRWSDFLDTLVIPPGGCYSEGYGHTTDDIFVVVIGGSFSTNTDDGTYIALLPDPHDVTVRAMFTGTFPFSDEGDC
jgi:hypothetical protein